MDFPLTLDKKYLGYVDYLLRKQELAKIASAEVTAFDGFKLMAKYLVSFRSIQKGYKNHGCLEAKLDECTSRGEFVALNVDSANLTLSIRSASN